MTSGPPALPSGGVTYKTVDTCGAEFEAHTPYHYSTTEDEDEILRPPVRGCHPGLGTQPDRSGHRVRLLLRPRLLRPPGRRLRDGHGQLQSRDGVDRLRHVGPVVLRALTPRIWPTCSRPRFGPRSMAVGWWGSSSAWAGRRRSSWRPASPRSWSSGRPRPPSTWPRTVSGGTTCAAGWASPNPRWHRHHCGRCGQGGGVGGYPVLVRPSYVLGGRAMEIVYDDERLVRGGRGHVRCRRVAPVGRWRDKERPVLVDRFSRMRWRWMSTRCATPPARWSSAA